MTRHQRILAAVATVAGLVLAPAKAHATGGEDTDGFLNALTAAGIPYADPMATLYVGIDICGNILAGKPAIPPAPTSILGPQDDFWTDAQQAVKGAQLPRDMSGLDAEAVGRHCLGRAEVSVPASQPELGRGFTMKRNLAALAAAALVTAPPASADPNLTAAEQRFVDAVYATGIPLAGKEIDLAMVGLDICDDQEHGEGNPRITSRLATSAGITLAQATVIVTDADAYLCSAPSR